MNEAPRLAEILRAIARGRAVDWDTVEASPADQSTSALIAELKILGRIAEVHSGALRETDAEESDDASVDSWGPLTILESVGCGSYGDVYRAWDTRLDREVALKLLRQTTPAETSPIIEEGRLLARVRHTNAITVYGADSIDGRDGIWMEFIDGRTLEEELLERGPLPVADVISIGIDICRALDAVHQAGVVHRDIKAQNVMRERNGRIVLMDFGSGQSQGSDETAVGGTPLYLAPEVLAGEAASRGSDIYAVGVLLYHLLTGRYPVEGQALADIRALHRENAAVPLREIRSDIPKRLTAAIERALALDPSARYESAAAFATALSSVMTRRVRKLVLTAATIVPVAVVAVLAWNWQKRIVPVTSFHARDWVLVTAFDNGAGDAVPDGAIEYIFERELSNSRFVNIVPRDRIDDTLILMARARGTRVDASLGREVAIRDGGIRALIVGRIQKIGQRFELSTQIVNPADGVALASISDAVADDAQLLAAIRREAAAIRTAVGEQVARSQNDGGVERVTTPSLRAAQLYTQADRTLAAGGSANAGVAAQLLEQAIASDPTFPSAHVLLARAYFSLDEGRKAADHFQRAHDLERASSERERLFINAAYQDYVLQEPAKAAEMYEALLRVYPDHYWAISDLSSIYFRLQRNADRDPLAVRLADLRPTSVTANWAAFNALSSVPGGFERARPYFDRCVALVAQHADGVSPELVEDIRWFPVAHHWREGEVTAAHDDLIRVEREGVKPSVRSAYLHMTFGELDEAERRLAQAQPPDRNIHLALMALFRGNTRDAREYLADAEQLPTQSLGPAAAVLIHLGKFRDAQRTYRQLANRLARAKNPFYAWTLDKQIVQGMLVVAAGRVAEGAALLEAVVGKRPFNSPISYLAWESLADGYREMGRTDDALRVLRQASSAGPSPNNPTAAFAMRIRVQLAQMERQAGHTAEAEMIEASLRRQLAFADSNHPLVKLLRQ